ncbi:MAG: orotidine-5'-phosphate decarboxylase [Deltaproteobacteria bacterium]|nr:orotidine-5'-phosphate decarboxylase [Deltaproteobacteria bacterium]
MFADRLTQAIKNAKSSLCAGLDVSIEKLPRFIRDDAASKSNSNDELIYTCLTRFFNIVIPAIAEKVAAIKPNLAYFEQYGVAGLRAYCYLRDLAQSRSLLVIADAKRGDIGPTAEAYAKAFLSPSGTLNADALTVNPFLGLDTLEPFVKIAAEHGRGVFVLVKTSNPGSAALQSPRDQANRSASEIVADWLTERGSALQGSSGWSSLGAVIGATYPAELTALRSRMPKCYFLVPGMGAQGGSAADAAHAFAKVPGSAPGGAVINVSRGIFGELPQEISNDNELATLVAQRTAGFNDSLNAALL